jgi:hypothetical protein
MGNCSTRDDIEITDDKETNISKSCFNITSRGEVFERNALCAEEDEKY